MTFSIFLSSPTLLYPDKFKEPAKKDAPTKRRRTMDDSDEEDEESEEEEEEESEDEPPSRSR